MTPNHVVLRIWRQLLSKIIYINSSCKWFAALLTRQSSLRFANSLHESISVRQFVSCRFVSVAENTWEAQRKQKENRFEASLVPALNFKSSAGKTGKSKETFTRTPKAGIQWEEDKEAGVQFHLGLVYLFVILCVFLWLCALWGSVGKESPLWEPWADPWSKHTRWWRAPRWSLVSWSPEGQRKHWPGKTGLAGTQPESSPAHRYTKRQEAITQRKDCILHRNLSKHVYFMAVNFLPPLL